MISRVRSALYGSARLLGDVAALASLRPRRIVRRLAGAGSSPGCGADDDPGTRRAHPHRWGVGMAGGTGNDFSAADGFDRMTYRNRQT